ncbi:MAG: GGDEF domain-containing protein [Clostridiales bacterium]|nr:GGDEF domain-containing protein [Clostridiales bacterium]
MDNFPVIYPKWRQKLYYAALLIACVTLALELIVSYLIYTYLPGMITLPFPGYFLRYIVIPSAFCFLFVIIGKALDTSKRIPDNVKKYMSILVITMQIFTIAYIHNAFSFTNILFIIPILLTLIYSDKLLTNTITIVSIMLMLIIFAARSAGSQTNYILDDIKIFISLILVAGCSVITNLLTDIEKDKSKIIKDGIFRQLQLEELIKCDPLTGLYNISSFYNTLDKAIKKNKMPLCIAVVDIDNFKLVNDTWGHDKANEVLIYIAAQLQYCCGIYGHVFRYGGEEFAIVFSNTAPAEAKAMLETAQRNIYNHDFGCEPQLKITFSCGIAAYPSSDYNAHEFFQLADKIMYQAKFSGKNKILIGTPSNCALEN